MSLPTTALSGTLDNLKSRISRLYFDERQFKDDSEKKDKAILMLADDLTQPVTFAQ